MSLNPFKGVSKDIRRAMYFGIAVVIGGGLMALGGLGWAIFSSADAPRVLVGAACSLFLGWLVTVMFQSQR